MKKIFVSTLILALTATAISYAGLSEPNNNERTTENHGGFFSGDGHSSSSSDFATSSEQIGGFFRDSSDPSDPGTRPGTGEGIGQEAPLHDGLHVLIACCVVFLFIKIYNEKRHK